MVKWKLGAYALECLFRREPLLRVLHQQLRYEVLGILRDLIKLWLIKVVIGSGDIAESFTTILSVYVGRALGPWPSGELCHLLQVRARFRKILLLIL